MPTVSHRIAKLTADVREITAAAAKTLSLSEAERLPVGSVLTFATAPGQFQGTVIVSAPGRGSPDLGAAKDVERDPDFYSMPLKEWASSWGRLIYLVHKGRGSLPSESTVSRAVSNFMRGKRASGFDVQVWGPKGKATMPMREFVDKANAQGSLNAVQLAKIERLNEGESIEFRLPRGRLLVTRPGGWLLESRPGVYVKEFKGNVWRDPQWSETRNKGEALMLSKSQAQAYSQYGLKAVRA